MATAWEGRLKQLSITTPETGQEFTPKYEDLTTKTPFLSAVFNFPGTNGTFVQPNAVGSEIWPVRLFFVGPSHDLLASRFERALKNEKGLFTLVHPTKGVLRAAPVGDVERKDLLKTESNQTIVEVVFYESLASQFPRARTSPLLLVEDQNATFLQIAINVFRDRMRIINTVQRAVATKDFGVILGTIRALAPEGFRDNLAEATRAFDIFQAVRSDLDRFVAFDEPETLARRTTLALLAVARFTSVSVWAKMDVFKTASEQIAAMPVLVQDADNTSENTFIIRGFFLNALLSAAIETVGSSQLENQDEAFRASATLTALFEDTVTPFFQSNVESLGLIYEDETYSTKLQAVYLSARLLVEQSFSLARRRDITLDAPRNVVELLAELYGRDFESEMDFFIDSNGIGGDEFFSLPIGRKLSYYK